MKKILFLILASAALHSQAQADITPKVQEALKKGDASALASYFMPQVDISLSGQDDTYGKDEARQVLAKFFSANPPRDFTVKHSGTSKLDDQYRIGELVTAKQTFRVTFFMKKSGGNLLIQQLKIESPNDDF